VKQNYGQIQLKLKFVGRPESRSTRVIDGPKHNQSRPALPVSVNDILRILNSVPGSWTRVAERLPHSLNCFLFLAERGVGRHQPVSILLAAETEHTQSVKYFYRAYCGPAGLARCESGA